MKKYYKYILSLLAFSIFKVNDVLAQGFKNAGTELDKIGKGVGAPESDVTVIVGTVIKTALTLVGLIFFILMIYAGFLWLTDRGKEEQAKTAQKIITSSIIGLVIVMSAYAITYFVMSKLGVK